MFKLSRRTAVAAATCLFALSGVVSAAELTGTLKKVQETGSITLGYRESSVPFSYLNADGKPVGYAFTVCQRVADAVKSELGLKSIRLSPAPTAFRSSKTARSTLNVALQRIH